MSFRNRLIVACLCVVTMMFYGCVDIPDSAPEFPDFRTQTRFIQADATLGTASILVDGAGQGSVDYRNSSGYMDLPAGNRSMQVQGDADQASIALESDANVTVVVFPKDTPTAARFRSFKERQSFQSVPSDTAMVRFISAGLDTGGVGIGYDIVDASDTSVIFASNLSLRANSGYVGFGPGSVTLGVVETGTANVLATADVSINNGQSFTAVIFGDQSSLSLNVFQDR